MAVAEAQAQLKDQEEWALERQRMEAEVGRAREMEKEAYDRYEVSFTCSSLLGRRVFLIPRTLDTFVSSRCQAVEQLRAQAAKEAEALGKELEEVKAGP